VPDPCVAPADPDLGPGRARRQARRGRAPAPRWPLHLTLTEGRFEGAKEDTLAATLDSLAALGLAVASGAGAGRSRSVVR